MAAQCSNPRCRAVDLPLSTRPSPFEKILHLSINQNPQIENVDSAHSSVEVFARGLQAELDALENQIAVFESTLASLREQHQATTEMLLKHRAIISPVNYIPTEILADIFGRDVDDYGGCKFHESAGEQSRKGPWRLLKVCQRWGEVAQGTPASTLR